MLYGGIILGVLLFLGSDFARNLTNDMLRPFLVTKNAVTTTFEHMFPGIFSDTPSKQQKIEELQNRGKKLRAELRRSRVAIKENKQLRELMSLRPPPSWQLVTAPVIARDPVQWRQSFRIGKGRRHGIRPQQIVLAGEYVVGRVNEVTALTAKVATVANPECRLSVRIENTETVGIYEGAVSPDTAEKDLYGRISYLSRDEDIPEEGDVVTSGLTKHVPEGFRVGQIQPWNEGKTKRVVKELYAEARIELGANLGNFRFVNIAVPQNGDSTNSRTPSERRNQNRSED